MTSFSFSNEVINKSVALFHTGSYLGMLDGGKVGTTFYDNFLRFLDHFISIFGKENGYGKFQLLKLSNKKVGCELLWYRQ